MTERRKFLLLFAVAPLIPSMAIAGAWSHESFANDGALDWVAEFSATPTSKFLQETFSHGTQDVYIENYPGESIIAAGEVVAASLGRPSTDLPKELAPLISKHRKSLSSQVGAARKAVRAVLGSKSELREIWGERAEGLARWEGSVQGLLKRLN